MLAGGSRPLEEWAVIAGGHDGRVAAELLAKPVAVPDRRVVQERRDLAQPFGVAVGEQDAPAGTVDSLEDLLPVHPVGGELAALQFPVRVHSATDTARFQLPPQGARFLARKAGSLA